MASRLFTFWPVWFFSSLFCLPSFATTLGLGLGFQPATSAIDHAKLDASIRLRLFESSSWSYWSRTTSAIKTTQVVNPGAGNNPSAPDEKESSSGQASLFSEQFMRTPWGSGTWVHSVGLLFNLPNFSKPGVGSVIAAPSYHFSYSLLGNADFGLHVEAAAGITVQESQHPFIIVPGAGLDYRPFSGWELALTTQLIYVRTLSDSLSSAKSLSVLALSHVF